MVTARRALADEQWAQRMVVPIANRMGMGQKAKLIIASTS